MGGFNGNMDTNLLEKKIEEVEQVDGSGTGMVSLYVASGNNLQSEQNRISSEVGEAENIKSKTNRKNVKKALERVRDILKRYSETPEDGLVVFAGVSSEGMVEFVFDDLPSRLDHSDYICDSSFHTEELRELIAPEISVGLAIVKRGGCAIGELRGSAVEVYADEDSDIMSQHRAGGQSSTRFERLIEEAKEEFFKEVHDMLEENFVNSKSQPLVDGFVLGSSSITADSFRSGGYIPDALEDVFIGSYPSDSCTGEGLEKLVEKARTEINEVMMQEERTYMNTFLRALHSESESTATYGEESVEKALSYGAVDVLLVSENRDRDEIVAYKEKVENQGGELCVISSSFSEGEQFWKGFNGLGALLRYEIE